MNASEVKALLHARTEEVCRMLLPAGKTEGRFFIIGDVTGKPGTSLKVNLDGQHVGYWKDFAGAAEDKGSLLDLWMRARNIPFKQAFDEACKWLGVDGRSGDGKFYKPAVASAPAPSGGGKTKADFKPLQEGSAVYKYLTEERKIAVETLKVFGVGESFDGKAIAFPYRTADGMGLQMVKFIALERPDGKKHVWTTKDPQHGLFGKQTVKTDQAFLVICEGEIDAMTVHQAGMNAVSVPFGAKWDNKDGKNPNDAWIREDYEFLEQFTELFLCFDADEPGRLAAVGLAKRLGVERCLLVRLAPDAKDPNDLLKLGRIAELGAAVGNAKSLDPEHLKDAGEFRKEVEELFFPVDGKEVGLEFMWPIPFRIRPREVTTWSGFSGHGKTLFLSHLMVHFMDKYGQKICLASMEIPASMTLQNMWRQACGRAKPESKEQFNELYSWFQEKVWLYDRMGDVDFTEVLSVFRYAARRYGVRHFILDSLAKLKVAHDDYDKQRAIMDALCALAKETDGHVHFVAHSKKPQHDDEKRIPLKYDVSGSSAITNLTWNGVTIWRNKAKEHALNPQSPYYENNPGEREAYADVHDAFFWCWKQRINGDEPVKKLYFDRESWQFHAEPGERSIIYAR